jgi:hypothetical protein
VLTKNMAKTLACGVLVLFLASPGAAQPAEFRGQLSAWSAAGRARSSSLQFGVREASDAAIPESLFTKASLRK